MDTLDWREHAACLGKRSDIFFDGYGEDAAKQLCWACPVQEECLAFALKTEQNDGIWGGLTAQERHNLLRRAFPGSSPLRTVTYTTRARSTGARCSAGRTREGWGVLCREHDSLACARDRAAAEYAVSRPEEWCRACAQVAAGEVPRIEG